STGAFTPRSPHRDSTCGFWSAARRACILQINELRLNPLGPALARNIPSARRGGSGDDRERDCRGWSPFPEPSMANTLSSPTMGFQSFGRQEGASPTDGLTPCWIASTDASLIFRGDPVVTSSAGGTNLSGNYITSLQISSPSSGFLARGVFQ